LGGDVAGESLVEISDVDHTQIPRGSDWCSESDRERAPPPLCKSTPRQRVGRIGELAASRKAGMGMRLLNGLRGSPCRTIRYVSLVVARGPR
jgi:hypothetical protein